MFSLFLQNKDTLQYEYKRNSTVFHPLIKKVLFDGFDQINPLS
jgi:hypothetical protein